MPHHDAEGAGFPVMWSGSLARWEGLLEYCCAFITRGANHVLRIVPVTVVT